MTERALIADALAAGAALSEIKMVNGAPLVVVPEGYAIQDLSKSLGAPVRKAGKATLRDAASFVAYASKHWNEHATLYFQNDPPSFTAVFNDHAAGAGWGDFVAAYPMPLSKEWQTWLGGTGKRMGQEDFAFFIETNLPDLLEPSAAEFLEIAQSIQAKKKVNFASGIRISNGQNELVYEETIEAKAGEKGKLVIPEDFAVAIPVFEGDAPYRVNAKLRYRITDNRLALWYDLERPHKVLEDAVAQLRGQIEQQLETVALHGTPAR